MPFGSIGSVHGWDRIGSLLRHLGRRLLFIPLCRYVDDYFSVDREEVADHAMTCFARVVRALLGASSVAERKLEAAMPLVVLGLQVMATEDGVDVQVSEEKAVQWSQSLEVAQATGLLASGDASKTAGRLSFAAQHTFARLGRAMLRPLFAQQYSPLPGGKVGPLLRMAMKWWLQVLKERRCQTVPWSPAPRTADLFCDARGSPARVAAILFVDGEVLYTDWEPSAAVMKTFAPRRDEQIMGQELLAIAVGMSTFANRLAGRSVRVWTDNAGGEGALKCGAAHSSDHNMLVHGIWLLAWRLGCGLWIERVPTKENLADLPSRESYELVGSIGGVWTPPWLEDAFWQPCKWESVALT